MTTDTFLAIAGVILGICGLGVSVFAIIDNRQQRGAREKAVIAAHEVIQRGYGLLIGIKPLVASLPGAKAAIDDGLSAINEARAALDKL
jgi:hypothetical protein